MAAALAACTAGCITTGGGSEIISFQAKSYQQAVLRDGDMVISSRGRYSVVSVRPATHLVGDRPIFIVGIENISRAPLDFRLSEATAGQVVDGATKPLRVYTYDELIAEEQNAQVGRAVLVGVLSGVSSGLAGNSYYGQALAEQQNAQLAMAAAATGQQNMAALEQLAIKDHTLMPGESYAGKVYVESPASMSGPKVYSIVLKVGPDRHEFQIVQAPAVR